MTPVRARAARPARDAKMLANCGGVVKDTPRQDILPRLAGGLLSAQQHAARGSLFPQPWMKGGQRMDAVAGNGWRLALAAGIAVPAAEGVRVVSLADEVEGVAAAWFRKNECVAALVRPDNYVFGVAASEREIADLLREFAAAVS